MKLSNFDFQEFYLLFETHSNLTKLSMKANIMKMSTLHEKVDLKGHKRLFYAQELFILLG